MSQKRNIKLLFIFLTGICLLMARVFYLQICAGKNLSRAASVQRTSSSEVEKGRGEITDKNGIPFTDRTQKFTVVLKPLYLRNDEKTLQLICGILGLDFIKMKRDVEIKKEPLLFDADEEKKNGILKLNTQGASVINSLGRYDENTLAKHVIGYINKLDKVGETGIEKFYDNILECGQETDVGVVTDAHNNLVQGLGYRFIETQGKNAKLNVKLTLDYHIQKIVEDVLNSEKVMGAVVIEDVNSGDIVAMASKPDFDPNSVENYLHSSKNELFNRAVASYNLGSIFKIVDVAYMFENNVAIDSEYDCHGSIQVGNRIFKCSSYNKGGHGVVDLNKAFALSCNPYFINAGIKIGSANLIELAKKFGLGSDTGLQKQGVYETKGNLPSSERFFTDGDAANIAIGQGEILATPLQVANMVAIVANGGIRNTLNIVDSIVDDDGNKVKDLKVKDGVRVISTDTAYKIRTLMKEVVTSGTGSSINLEKYGGAAGKTGSAETGNKDVTHAWFAGYIPRLSPKYAISVFVENGKSGSKTAVPIFSKIAQKILVNEY